MKILNKVKAPISAEGITQGKIYDVVCSTPNDITEYHFTIVDDNRTYIKCDLNNCEKLAGNSWVVVSSEEFRAKSENYLLSEGDIYDQALIRMSQRRYSGEVISEQGEIYNPQAHYDNSKGSLYKIAGDRGWNSYIFDIVKRLERGGKKDPLEQEISKSIDVLKVWLQDIEQESKN